MKKFLFYLAVSGLIISLLIHLISLSGTYIGGIVPINTICFIGILIVLLAATLKLRKNQELTNFSITKSGSIVKFLNFTYKDTPKFILILTTTLILYAVLNYFLSNDAYKGYFPDIIDGNFVAIKYGSFMKEISESEYFRMKANKYRSSSGEWMAIYAFALSTLWPQNKQ